MVARSDAVAGIAGRLNLTPQGFLARAGAAVALAVFVFMLPVLSGPVWDQRIGLAAIYAIIGLSVNVITGHAGQISLGHQAFVGIGAFVAAYVATKVGGVAADAITDTDGMQQAVTFFIALPVAAATGGAMAAALGLAALRIRGLYLALITLAFGGMAEATIFGIRGFTGGGAGAQAPRPPFIEDNGAFATMALVCVALVLFLDWRLTSSKAGRAIVSLRNDERVAATLGVNVVGYKLLAFVVSGVVAGLAGGLFAYWNQFVQALDFDFFHALTWVLMAVVGGLGSRAGVVMGSAFFAILPLVFPASSINVPLLGDVVVLILAPLVGALLLILTVTKYPGGIGQQIAPLRRWMSGGPLLEHHKKHGGKDIADAATLESAPRAGTEEPSTLELPAIVAVDEPGDEAEEPTVEFQRPKPAAKRKPARKAKGSGARKKKGR